MAVERIGVDEIKAGYKMYTKYPYYAVFDANHSKSGVGDLLFSFIEDDKDGAGWELLQENMNAAGQSQPSTAFVIRFYDQLEKNDAIRNTTPYTGCFKMRMNRLESAMTRVSGAGSTDMMQQLFQAKLDLLEQKYEQRMLDQAREHEEAMEELEAEQEEDKMNGADGAMGQVYQWADMIGNLGTKHDWMRDNINKLFTTVNDFLIIGKHKVKQQYNAGEGSAGRQRAASMGNVHTDASPETRINNAIKKLLTWYTLEEGSMEDQQARQLGAEKCAEDFELLADLTHDPDVIHLALKKLRALA